MRGFRFLQIAAFVLLMIYCCPLPAMGYIGPGTGMSAVGVFLAVAMGVIVALFGFLWYPIKRVLRMCRHQGVEQKGEEAV